MIFPKIGKRRFAAATGRITNDTYSATIKKLALLQEKGFVQLAPARLVAGKMHLETALEHAFSAIDSGQAFTKRPELEFLVWLLGEKQLYRAMEKARFGQGEGLVLVAEAKNRKYADAAKKALGFTEDRSPTFNQKEKNRNGLMREFRVTENELAPLSGLEDALERLVIEKISLVALER